MRNDNLIIKPIESLGVYLMDEFPSYGEKSPERVVSAIAFRTFEDRELHELYNDEKIVSIILEVLEKGFASIGNFPQYLLKIVGPRTLDFTLTQSQFLPSLVFSQRYRKENIAYLPNSMSKYQEIVKKQFNLYNEIISFTSPNRAKEIARRILPFGSQTEIYIIANSENLANFFKYLEIVGGLPKDYNVFLSKLEKILINRGFVKALERSSKFSESIDRILFREDSYNATSHPLIDVYISSIEEFITNIKELNDFYKESIKDIINKQKEFLESKIGKEELIEQYRKFELKFNSIAERFVFRSSRIYYSGYISVVNWNELKRHRTIDLWVEPIYLALEETYKILSKGNWINRLDEIKSRVDIPRMIERNEKLLLEYLKITYDSLKAYFESIVRGVPKEEAIYIIPQNIKLKVRISMGFDQLFNMYKLYGIRTCLSAETGMLEFMYIFQKELLSHLKSSYKEVYDNIYSLISPKCRYRCLEPYKRRKQLKCNLVLKNNPEYSLRFHKNIERR